MKSFDHVYREWKIKIVSKLFEFIKQGAGRRILQLTVLSNELFEASITEPNENGILGGLIVAKAKSKSADGALVSLAIEVMKLTPHKRADY